MDSDRPGGAQILEVLKLVASSSPEKWDLQEPWAATFTAAWGGYTASKGSEKVCGGLGVRRGEQVGESLRKRNADARALPW